MAWNFPKTFNWNLTFYFTFKKNAIKIPTVSELQIANSSLNLSSMKIMNIYVVKVVTTCGLPLPPIFVMVNPIPRTPIESDSGACREKTLKFFHGVAIDKILR